MSDRLEHALERLEASMDRVDHELHANREERAEMRQFMRELTLRHERATEHVVDRLEAMGERLADMGDQLRANTAATWAIVDRLGPAA
jgi:chromosome segregation ATPase